MAYGVNFQPGGLRPSGAEANGRAPGGGLSLPAVQEAIRVLSLRLPKQVGPNAVAPAPLLTSPGSGGNPMVDSVVQQVLQQYFPTASPAPASGMGGAPPSVPAPAPPHGVGGPPPGMVAGRTITRPPHVVTDQPPTPPTPEAPPSGVPPSEAPLSNDRPDPTMRLLELIRKKNLGMDYEPPPMRSGGPTQTS